MIVCPNTPSARTVFACLYLKDVTAAKKMLYLPSERFGSSTMTYSESLFTEFSKVLMEATGLTTLVAECSGRFLVCLSLVSLFFASAPRNPLCASSVDVLSWVELCLESWGWNYKTIFIPALRFFTVKLSWKSKSTYVLFQLSSFYAS